ncbi:MAG: helix-turn-helix domain-containing protein [Acidobacteriota bacterium]|nr:MAG: helix-turn-helix domain-containing protein [Acidobacteriota bacterium]
MSGQNSPLSFGEALRREREARGVSLEEIARKTRISRRHLEALEQERFESLPGRVFAKGFVRAYCECIGANAADFLERCTALSERQAADDVSPTDRRAQSDPSSVVSTLASMRRMEPRKEAFLLFVVLVGLALAGVVPAVWSALRATHRQTPPASPSVSSEVIDRTPQILRAIGEETLLTVRALRRTHVYVEREGDVFLDRELFPGEERTYPLGRAFSLRAGYAAALRLTVAGKELSTPPGRSALYLYAAEGKLEYGTSPISDAAALH